MPPCGAAAPGLSPHPPLCQLSTVVCLWETRTVASLEDMLRTLIREELDALKHDLLAELRHALPPTRSANTPEYLTTEEAAELAGVTPATIREWIKSGTLRERRAGQKLLIKTTELHAHLAGELEPDEDVVVERELARLGLR